MLRNYFSFQAILFWVALDQESTQSYYFFIFFEVFVLMYSEKSLESFLFR